MGRNTSISLGNHFETFIESTISKGRYTNASEVVRAGLRLLEEEENKVYIVYFQYDCLLALKMASSV